MKTLGNAAQKLLGSFKQKRMFWRILLLYLAGSVILLGVFSTVLTAYLTNRARQDAITRNRDALGQAYATAEYVLNTTYDAYYKRYQSSTASTLMFEKAATAKTALQVGAMFDELRVASDCVDSVYIINRAADKVYASDGRIFSMPDFPDTQAMELFRFYNENSNTLFLPRTVSLPDTEGVVREHCYVSLIFSRRNAVSIPMGGMIVNLDETHLIELLARDIEAPGSIYIVSENGSILANSDTGRVNTSIYGSPLWEELTAHSAQEDFSFTASWGGEPCLITGKNASRLRFCFLYITPMAELEQGVAYIRSFTLLCSVAFLALAFVLAMTASRVIYSPISRLVTNLRQKPLKDQGAQAVPALPAPPQDEVSFLDSAYDKLYTEVETLAHDNHLMAHARQREVLLRLLRGEYPTEEKCRAEALALALPLDCGGYLAAVLRFDNFVEFGRNLSTQDLALYRYALMNVTAELLSERCVCSCAEVEADQIAILICLPAQNGGEELLPWLRTALGKVNEAMAHYLKCTVSGGIGTPVQTLMELVTSYNRAMTATAYRLVTGRGVMIAYEEIAGRQSLTPEYPMEADAVIVQALRSRNAERACAGIDTFFASFALANVDTIDMATTQLTISLSRTVHSMAAGHEGTRQLPNYRVLSILLDGCDTLSQRKEVLKNYCCKMIEIRNSEVQTKKESLIEQIKGYIETNYANPMLNTEDIAAYAELSPNYLRTVFKNAVGRSPTDYLADYRIDRAKELLATTDTATKEIAAAVGYYNHRYFYSVFKAKVGMTATAYRAEQRGRRGPQPAAETEKNREGGDKPDADEEES